jgi:sulfur carrier protein
MTELTILFNGNQHQIPATETSLPAVLKKLGFDADFFAVAVNGTFIPRSCYEQTQLRDRDELEIVVPMQGG